MVATSGSSSTSNWSRCSSRRLPACDGPLVCEHGAKPVVRTCSTIKNSGRRFYECPSYNGAVGSGCEFFIWVPEGMCAHSIEISARAKRKLLEAEANLNCVKTTYRLVIFFLSLVVIGAFFAWKMSV